MDDAAAAAAAAAAAVVVLVAEAGSVPVDGVLLRFNEDRLTGVCRLRFEHKFNGCSLDCFDEIERSNGLTSSVLD